MQQQEKIVIFENAVKHRQNIFKDTGNRGIQIETDEEVINIPFGYDEWICDFCNDTMPVKTKDDQLLSMLSLNGTHTLCFKCWKNTLTNDNSLFDNIMVCTCCQNNKAKLYAFKEVKEGFKSFIRFEAEEQATDFGNMYMELTDNLCIYQRK